MKYNRSFYCINCQEEFNPSSIKSHLAFSHGMSRTIGAKELIVHMRMSNPKPDKYIWRWNINSIKMLEFIEMDLDEAIQLAKQMGFQLDLTTGEFKQ